MIADKKSIDLAALKAAGITDDQIADFLDSRIAGEPVRNNPAIIGLVKSVRKAGVSIMETARIVGVDRSVVTYHTCPGTRAARLRNDRIRKARAQEAKAGREYKPDGTAEVDKSTWGEHDAADPVYIVNRKIDLLPRKTSDRRRKQGPRPHPETPKEVRDHRSRIERATDIYFARLARGERVLLSECL